MDKSNVKVGRGFFSKTLTFPYQLNNQKRIVDINLKSIGVALQARKEGRKEERKKERTRQTGLWVSCFCSIFIVCCSIVSKKYSLRA